MRVLESETTVMNGFGATTTWHLSHLPVTVIVSTLALLGCNQNPAGTPSPPATVGAAPGVNQQAYMAELQRRADRQQQGQLDAELTERARVVLGRYDELERRAKELDRNNSELHARLAQVKQRNQLLEDQNHLLQTQLDETSKQLATSIDATKESEQRIQTMLASTRRKGGATITPNNSYRRNLTAVMVPGLAIRQDGDVVRIELPADTLFESRTARLTPESTRLLDEVASVILKDYPRQIVGVEVHTDNTPLAGTLWRNPHQLTAAQSMAVFEQLSNRHQLLPQQMFVMGHGQNHPLASNATTAGQARNRRVEIVVYPNLVGQRGDD